MCDSATEDKKTSMVCRAVGVQLGMGFSGQKSRRFLLVAMTMVPEGVVLPVRGVILEPIPSARIPLGENHVHLLDE